MNSFTSFVLLALALAVTVCSLVPASHAGPVLPGHPNESTTDQRGEMRLAPQLPVETGRSIRVARGLGKRLRKIGKKIDHGVRKVKIGEIGFGMPKGKTN